MWQREPHESTCVGTCIIHCRWSANACSLAGDGLPAWCTAEQVSQCRYPINLTWLHCGAAARRIDHLIVLLFQATVGREQDWLIRSFPSLLSRKKHRPHSYVDVDSPALDGWTPCNLNLDLPHFAWEAVSVCQRAGPQRNTFNSRARRALDSFVLWKEDKSEGWPNGERDSVTVT